MAKLANLTLSLIVCYFLVCTTDVSARQLKENNFLRIGAEGVVKLTFYVQDLRVGNPNPTVYEVASASVTGNSPTNFGSVHVIDDLLTAGTDYNSKAVGRAQGLTTSADQTASAAAMNLNFYFTTGKFNGSTICILGRNPFAEAQRELVVAGGTGAFRYAKGYALTSNIYDDPETNYSVLQYIIYTTYNTKINEGDDEDVEIAEM